MRRAELLTLVALAACRGRDTPPASAIAGIPVARAPITLDGEWDEDDWPQRARRFQLRGDDGELARPSSELRVLHDDHDLFVGLYAADEDIETTDVFELVVGDRVLRIDAAGHVTPALANVRVGIDRDGSLDDAHDDDEEWVVELAVPLALAGPAPINLSATRCDVPKDQIRRCGRWSGRLGVE